MASSQVMTKSALVGWGKQDVVGQATITIVLYWNVTIADKIEPFIVNRVKRITIWTTTTSILETKIEFIDTCKK